MDTTNYPKETLHSLCGRTIIRISNNLVVKSGNLRSHEAQTLRFIKANTTIPVPKVHDIHWQDDQVVNFPLLTNSIPISNQLRNLRGTYIGAINHGKAIIGQIDSLEGGPFTSEQEFNGFILGDIVPSAPELLRHYARFALSDDHEIVFTHADFAPRNILVDGGRVTAILDWEYAGWYPEYWEYVQALRQLRPMKDWPEYLARILPPSILTTSTATASAKAEREAEADYLIIGGGTTGLLLANRLSSNPTTTVLILDPGKDTRTNPNVTNPTQWLRNAHTEIDWAYPSTPQSYALNRTLSYTAGRILGGTSMINGMTYLRGDKPEIDAWEALVRH
ncbi:hypothetical protein CNMCM5878_005871 [Aspergillus fumigatiaffinis]|nr:hypothetical protein CNMCM5878_005871 [Aspergillus fumigatiaffinis]